VTEIKSELRKRYRAEREFLVVESHWKHLLDSREVNAANFVASYCSYGDDLDWVIWSGKEEDLIPRGLVHEPIGDAYNGEIDVVIVPALHIDRRGNRLGQGGGSYDRALARTKAWKVALVYPGELTSEEVPREVHDQQVDAAATPEILVRFTEQN